MTPKQLTELEGFDKLIKWIVKERCGICFGHVNKPAIKTSIPKIDPGGLYWESIGMIVERIPFTLEWESDDWTKCIYEKQTIGDFMKNPFKNETRESLVKWILDIANRVIYIEERLKKLEKANGIEKDEL